MEIVEYGYAMKFMGNRISKIQEVSKIQYGKLDSFLAYDYLIGYLAKQ